MELKKNTWTVSEGNLWYRSVRGENKHTGEPFDLIFTTTGKFNPDVVGKKLFEEFINSAKDQFDRLQVSALLEHRSYIESLGLFNTHEITPGCKYYLYTWRSDSKYNLTEGTEIGSLEVGDSIKLHDYKSSITYEIIDRDENFTVIQHNRIKKAIPNDIIVVKI